MASPTKYATSRTSSIRRRLTHLGLPAALRELGRELSRRHDIDVDVQVSDRVPRVDYRPGLCLFRVAQEALSNVVRHAAATSASVALDYRDGWLRLVVEDDGKGFDPAGTATSSSLGLLGMRERRRVAARFARHAVEGPRGRIHRGQNSVLSEPRATAVAGVRDHATQTRRITPPTRTTRGRVSRRRAGR